MKQLKEKWKKREFQKCYLFYGAETYLVKHYAEVLQKEILLSGTETMNFDILEEKNATAAAIMDAGETLPFFHDKRLLVIRNSDFFWKNGRKEEGEKLLDFIENIPETTCILFIEEKVEKTGKLYKAIAKIGQVVEFVPLKENEMIVWLKKMCKSGGVVLSHQAAYYLLQVTDNHMENLEQEIQKLIAYKEGKGEIQIQDIDAVCSVSLEARVFDLVRAMGGKNVEKAVGVYRDLLTLKESPYTVLSLIARQFRMILTSALLWQKGDTQPEIAEKIGVRDFAVREYLKQSKHFTKEILEKALQDCLDTDIQIKSGNIAEDLAVELLLIQYSK